MSGCCAPFSIEVQDIGTLTPTRQRGFWRNRSRPTDSAANLVGPLPGRLPQIRSNYDTLVAAALVEGDDDPALAALDNLTGGRVRILISKPFHTRSAEPLWRRYRRAQARIYGHLEVATRLGDTSGFEAVTSGTDVGGLARFHPIGSPPRSLTSAGSGSGRSRECSSASPTSSRSFLGAISSLAG